MRVAFLPLLMVAVACGDDDVSAAGDAGFVVPDASSSAECVPYFLSAADRDARDAGNDMDAGGDGGTLTLMCDMPGLPDSECADIAWTFAGGEQISLVGCCTPAGICGGLDPSEVAGCITRDVFGLAPSSCTPASDVDAGRDDAGDDDASVPST